jgi:hypothetical protein
MWRDQSEQKVSSMAIRSRLSLALISLIGALTLSGCYYVDAVFDLNDEEELDVRIDTAVHEDFANEDIARSFLGDAFAGEGMVRTNYAEGPWNGYRFSENNGDPYNWEIVQSDGDFIRFAREGDYVSYTAKMTIGGDVGDREDEAKDLLDVQFTLDHVGTVISTNGNEMTDTRIRWTGEWDSTLEMEAVIDLTPAPAAPAPAEEAEAEEPEPTPAEPVEETTAQEAPEEALVEEDVVEEETAPSVGAGIVAIATAEISPAGGEIAIDGMVYPARSISQTIAAGSDVRVVALDGGTVIVEAIDQGASLGAVIGGFVIGAIVLGGGITLIIWLVRRRQPAAGVSAS